HQNSSHKRVPVIGSLTYIASIVGKGMDIETITKAFDLMGRYLRERNTIGEIAVYGGSAILLQFPWRKATEDVDATFGKTEASVKDAAAFAALELRLSDGWLNNSVGS